MNFRSDVVWWCTPVTWEMTREDYMFIVTQSANENKNKTPNLKKNSLSKMKTEILKLDIAVNTKVQMPTFQKKKTLKQLKCKF